jgi:hypothetical protein
MSWGQGSEVKERVGILESKVKEGFLVVKG